MAPWYELLEQARRETRISRRALANLSGVSAETIYSYEHNRRTPSRENLIQLAETLKLRRRWQRNL
jgi:transcriptional regulator with XRE-family HTH domain